MQKAEDEAAKSQAETAATPSQAAEAADATAAAQKLLQHQLPTLPKRL